MTRFTPFGLIVALAVATLGLAYAELYDWLRPGELLAEPPEGWVADWKAATSAAFTT